ncbi:unnamed protein product [Closterium sp. Yama58-4]|nr:unnamed protein product [Closterium sp. Yama58-4]
MVKGRNGKSGKKTADNALDNDVPDVPVKDSADSGTPLPGPASTTVVGPFEALPELPVAGDQEDTSTQEKTDGVEKGSEEEARVETGAVGNEDDGADAQPPDALDDEDDGYLSDASDEHLEPDSLNSILALKRFSLTLLVPISRKVEVKRAAVTIAALLDDWKELLSPEVLSTTTYQDLPPMYFSGDRYGRLQVTFNQVRDANLVWSQVIRHECVKGDFIDLTWQHPKDARFLRERVLNPTAKEVVVKGVPAEISAELIRRLLVVSKLVIRRRSAFASGFGFHRTVDPVSGLDTDRIRGLIISHADDEYRWRYFVEDPYMGKRYLLHFPSLVCGFCGGQHMTRYHNHYVAPRQENLNNWNLTVKKVHERNGISGVASYLLLSFDFLHALFSSPLTDRYLLLLPHSRIPESFRPAEAHHARPRYHSHLNRRRAGGMGLRPDGLREGAGESFRAGVGSHRFSPSQRGVAEGRFSDAHKHVLPEAASLQGVHRETCESLPALPNVLVMGDLNVVEDPELDRTSHSGSSAENQRLLSCWGNIDLRDAFRHMHPDKREYTFFAKATRSSSRIDRALISQPLLGRLVDAKHVAITNGMTDHWSGIGVVLESADAVKNGPGIWRLRAEQAKKEGVRKIVKKIVEESAGEPADRLLERLTACLRAYSREERKRETATRLHLTKEVERLRVRVSRYPHCQRTELDGEVASGILSAQIKTRKAKTAIRAVLRNGTVFSGVQEVLSAATDHFREAFGCPGGGAVSVTENRPMQRQLGEESRRSLNAPWTEEEVRKAVRELAPGKSPGADGLPKELFDYNWDLLGPILMDLVGRFTRGEILPQNITTAVTILLHKKGDKGDLGNYRLITLLSTVYKIVAKVMASRLKKVLHEVISEDQYGFIPGRQLADAMAVVADAIEAGANGKEDWFLLMIDFQKAFDSISRNFLFSTLRKLGTRLHINGWMGEKVAVEKGVRQGCPLAPYLFLCAVEPLCQEINRNKLGVRKRGVGRLAYLGYTDDTSLLLQGAGQLQMASKVLSDFGEESGLKVNEGKTVIFPLGKNRGKPAPQGVRYKWADKDDPERLLGIWITPNGDPTPSWNKALDRARGELAKWEMRHLTTSARVPIINSYIVRIFLFQAQVYLPPEAIWKKIRKLCHTFVSKGEAAEEKRFILWNYKLACTPREDGGLGLLCPELRVDSIAIRNVC